LIVTEVIDRQLRRAGTSATELFALMHTLGYEGQSVDLVRRGWSRELCLLRVRTPEECRGLNDVLWTHPDDASGQALLAAWRD